MSSLPSLSVHKADHIKDIKNIHNDDSVNALQGVDFLNTRRGLLLRASYVERSTSPIIHQCCQVTRTETMGMVVNMLYVFKSDDLVNDVHRFD